MAFVVAGEDFKKLSAQLREIERQLQQNKGYPFDTNFLRIHLQRAIEGRFAIDTSLLRPIAVVEVPKVHVFDAGKFSSSPNGQLSPVQIASVSQKFSQYFKPLVEEGIPKGAVEVSVLLADASSKQILENLGGAAKTAVTMYEFYKTLEWKQANFDRTSLGGFARDYARQLREIVAVWSEEGWQIYTLALEFMNWTKDTQFIHH